jgi:N-acetylglutamate synthase-like GNAT family acetyltransferase
MKIRRAIAPDARAIHALILHYAANGLLLPRSVEDVVRDIETFIVCEESRAIVGCLSLFEYHTGLAEIRSVAVEPARAGSGIGSRLVRQALEDASTQGIARVLAVTAAPEFFARLGFEAVGSAAMSEKVDRDCRGCKKAQGCALVPMLARPATLNAQTVLLPMTHDLNSSIATEC